MHVVKLWTHGSFISDDNSTDHARCCRRSCTSRFSHRLITGSPGAWELWICLAKYKPACHSTGRRWWIASKWHTHARCVVKQAWICWPGCSTYLYPGVRQVKNGQLIIYRRQASFVETKVFGTTGHSPSLFYDIESPMFMLKELLQQT